MTHKNSLQLWFSNLFSQKEVVFITWFVIIFIGTTGVLAAFGLLPAELLEETDGRDLSTEIVESAAKAFGGANSSGANDSLANGSDSGASSSNSNKNNSQKLTQVGYPVRLVIPSIQIDTKVQFPENTKVSTLDTELTKGPVYYPGSGTVNSGNMFIFGHSTGYKVVINKAYKVFNELKNVQIGAPVYVESEGKMFAYKVRSVDKVNKDDTMVKFDTTSHLLTLSTCNSFGAKTDRYVVVAEFVGEVK